MSDDTNIDKQSDVDRGLVSLFLRMSPDERLRANDNALRTIMEMEMPSSGIRPTNASLGELLEGLSEAGVDFILVGGFAAVVQGAPVTTMDVDIFHSQSPENIARCCFSCNASKGTKKLSDWPKF